MASLKPLFVCCLAFGWVFSQFLPIRYFISSGFVGQAIPVALIALPALLLAVVGIYLFVRPARIPTLLAFGTLFFTMIVGLAGLFLFQGLAIYSVNSSVHMGGKGAGVVLILRAVGWAYQSINSSSVIHQFFGFIFGVGLCEEMTKLLPLFFLLLFKGNRPIGIDYRGFLIVGFSSGLGFGIGEALYCYAPWSGNVVTGANVIRWFACVPAHGIYATTDAAILWLLAPKLREFEGFYQKLGIFALAAFAVAIVHGTYNVLSNSQWIGIAIDAATIVLMYYVVKFVDNRSSRQQLQDEAHSEYSPGFQKWIHGYETGQRRLKRLYLFAATMILVSQVFSSSEEKLQQLQSRGLEGLEGTDVSSSSSEPTYSIAELQNAARDVERRARLEREQMKNPTPEMVRRVAEESAAQIERAMRGQSTSQGSNTLNRANDYGSGAGVPLAPETQDVRKRFDADGRYAVPQPSQRTYDHR